MTRGTEQGKKIDDIRLSWDSHLIVRYHSSRNNPTFTVEAGDESFSGTDLKRLIEQATVHMNGWSDLKWEPFISIETEIYGDIELRYSRFFKSRHKGKDVFRQWRIGDENESSFGSKYREEKKHTGDRLDGGEPGAVMSSRDRGRVIPYTPDRWAQLRELSKKVREVMEKTAVKLSEMLKQKDIDTFLEDASGVKSLGIEFKKVGGQ